MCCTWMWLDGARTRRIAHMHVTHADAESVPRKGVPCGRHGLKLGPRPRHAAVDVSCAEVHAIPGEDIDNVVRAVGLVEDCIKDGENSTALLLGFGRSIWKCRREYMQDTATVCPRYCPAPARHSTLVSIDRATSLPETGAMTSIGA